MPRSHKMLQRRHPARQYAAALAHAGDADKVGPEVSAAMRLLALSVEDRRHVPVEGEYVRVCFVRNSQSACIKSIMVLLDVEIQHVEVHRIYAMYMFMRLYV